MFSTLLMLQTSAKELSEEDMAFKERKRAEEKALKDAAAKLKKK
ncbi:hypothetical protein EON66_10675 [archaeon]|nr:MAG: hypothetical protein EON66_10675 [archaeon]